MIFSIAVLLVSFVSLVGILRKVGISLGIPIAYFFCLLLIHLPGALVHTLGGDFLHDSEYTEIGIRLTAMGAVCFVVGVAISRIGCHRSARANCNLEMSKNIAMFCLIGGWISTYGLSFLNRIPSLGAAVERSGGVWMLGVILGLRTAVLDRRLQAVIFWLCAMCVYPVLMLLLGGFLSYGSTAVIIVLSVLVIATRKRLRVIIGVFVVAVFGFNLFLSYFQNRDDIRAAVWGGGKMESRFETSFQIFRDFTWFDPSNPAQLFAINERLNQNYLVGMAASRIDRGQVDYLYGRSLIEGGIALIPRLLWPNKPVIAGSPQIVSEMTGLFFEENTSVGVGNVMEFQINFGTPGVIIGFLILGWGIGILDRKAALAEQKGSYGQCIVYFLPAVTLIQPNGSIVELVSGFAAASIAGFTWKWILEKWMYNRMSHQRIGKTSSSNAVKPQHVSD